MSVLEAGQSFGRYTIINLDGTAGPIESYRAYDSSIARDVRLTVLASHDRAVSDRFNAAMVALLDLAHPSILDFYDAGDVAGVLYLAMPLPEGTTLAQRLLQGGMTPQEIGKIVEQVASALQYAHEHGIPNGALALDNILLDGRGRALLTGFGAGALAGGDDLAAAKRRDVLMLGGVLLALLAGHVIDDASSPLRALLQPWIDRLPPAVQAAAADRYGRFMARALSTDDTQRFNSIADLLAAWRQAAGPALEAQPGGAPSPGPRPMQGYSTADQIQAQRRADAATKAQSLQAGYDSQWRERVEAMTREAAETQARIQHESDERSDTMQRARLERNARIGTGSTVAVPAATAIDPAKRAALRQLLRTVQAVAEKRASTIGIRPLTTTMATARPAVATAKPAAPSATHRATPAVSRAATPARPAGTGSILRPPPAAEAASIGARVRPVLAVIIVFLFIVVCVFPLSCIIWVSTLPDPTPTPVRLTPTRAAPTQAVPPTAAPTRVPTSATPVVRASAAPAALPVDTVVVYTDTFTAGACRLPEGSLSTGTQSCAGGEFRMVPATTAPMWAVYEGTRGDMLFEVDARVITSTPSLEYGLIWGASANRFYGLTLKSDGALGVFTYQPDKFNYTIQGLSFSATNPGANGNRLRVRVSNGRFDFGINGRDLPFSMSAIQASTGGFGFFAQSREPGAGVAFSNVKVSESRLPVGSASPQPTAIPTR